MAYFISPSEGSDLQIQVENFLQQLHSDWSDVEIEKPASGDNAYLVNWSLTIEGYRQLGGIQNDRQTITIDDLPIAAAAKFAVWCRSQIPSKYKLFIYHPSSEHEFELSSITTEEELLDKLNND